MSLADACIVTGGRNLLVQLLDSLGHPTVMLFRPVEKSDQRVPYQRWRRTSRPKPSRYSGFEASSGIPESNCSARAS
jgi:hypothetical protein